jgi:hypothetical protein
MEMKIPFIDNSRYSINLKIAFIISESICICLFLLFPAITKSNFPVIEEPIILIDEIPVTVQRNSYPSIKPTEPSITFSEEINEPDILDNFVSYESAGDSESDKSENSSIRSALKLSSRAPKQLFEVLPQKQKEEFEGKVQLKLKIDEKGKVTAHTILYNSLECGDCLNEIITAAYNTKWEPGMKNGAPSEYWVEKSYSFN